jgi:hypothetical protein
VQKQILSEEDDQKSKSDGNGKGLVVAFAGSQPFLPTVLIVADGVG